MFKQNMYGIIKVNSMAVKRTSTEKGNFIIMETKGTLVPDGVFVTVSKLIKDSADTHQFMRDKIAEFESMVVCFEADKAVKKNYYVSVQVKPREDKEKKLQQYDKIRTETLDDGRIFIKIDGMVNNIPSEVIEDGTEVLKFKNKQVPVKDINPTILTFDMIYLSEDEDKITFTTEGNYPIELVAYKQETDVKVKGKGKVGQGYSITAEFSKGRMGKINKENLVVNWDGEDNGVNEREPDKIKIIAVKKIPNYTLAGLNEKSDMDGLIASMLG